MQFSRHLPETSDDLWIAQALSILSGLVPGDEEFGQKVLEQALDMITPEFMNQMGWHVPPMIWEREGLAVIKPFLDCFQQSEGVYVGPIIPTSDSILLATTQILSSKADRGSGLPLRRDWVLSPLDHLLKSGDSTVFKSLPSSWEAAETELVRSTLLWVKIFRELMLRHGLPGFTLTRSGA